MRRPFNLPIYLFLIGLILLTGCGQDEDPDSGHASQGDLLPDDDNDDLDDTEALSGEVAADECAPPVEMPEPYRSREAAWFVSRFEGEDLPVLGLYAYYWIDRYAYAGCSYSSNWVVWFKADGEIEDNFVSGDCRSGIDLEFGDNGIYDIFYPPRMRVTAEESDPYKWMLDLETEDVSGRLPLRLNHVRSWSSQWFAAYDAALQGAEISVGGLSYPIEGMIDFERWFDIGGAAPGSEEDDFINGAWLYDVIFWNDETGARVQTVTLYWIKSDGQSVWVNQATGAISSAEEEREIASLDCNLNFPENETSGGYPLRHAMTGTLEGGTEFSYDVTVVKDYRDEVPSLWADKIPSGHRESHALVSGTLTIGDRTFTGGGVYEWRVTDYNPLVSSE